MLRRGYERADKKSKKGKHNLADEMAKSRGGLNV